MKKLRVSLGLMTSGPPGSEAYGTRIASLDAFNDCLDHYQSRGYGEVDVARTYVNGLQEGWTKAAKRREHKLNLTTKWFSYTWGDHSKKRLEANFAMSLHELGTDCCSIFYLHAPDHSVSFRQTMEACNELYPEGRFEKLGLSNYAAWEVAETCNLTDQQGRIKPTVYQAMYNFSSRGDQEELIPCCCKYGIDILIYNPLAGGVLTGRYQSKKVPDDGGRYSRSDPVVGSMHRERYFRDAEFEASNIIKPVANRFGLTLLEIAFRRCVHHGKLRVVDGDDGIVIGVSSLSRLEVILTNLEQRSLPEETVKTLDMAWQMMKPSITTYWR